jgi:hypothetical protein
MVCSRTHDDVNLLGENVNTIKKKTQALLDASKGVGLHANGEKPKCMFMVVTRM